MHNWFISKAQYDKTMENGTQKKVTEPYLIDALSWTEAEARTIEELKPYIAGEFTIADISRYPLSELFFNENGDKYYKAVIAFITLDEKKRKREKDKSKYACSGFRSSKCKRYCSQRHGRNIS